MDLITVIAVTSLILLCSLLFFRKGKYQAISELNSRAEQNFFIQLSRQLNNNYILNSKVRLADIVKTSSRNKSHFYKVSSKHVDFVITEKHTSKIICCIELDDKSHNLLSSKKRDMEKNSALSSANVKLFRIKATRNYSGQLSNIIKYVNFNENNKVDTGKVVKEIKKPSKANASLCPRCFKPTFIKIELKFPNKGKFYHHCNSCGYYEE
ncbi:DUF2726 domain-containing protein [Photobacterium leiognathi]|uniref:DUF2726 domain-containing protein n=1 Tax=Photobacterium leiognathi TaxID=553611 RepID=UPI002733F6E8|nr:DUF2726 domain-containing protein [Photobacterium leiognathi]